MDRIVILDARVWAVKAQPGDADAGAVEGLGSPTQHEREPGRGKGDGEANRDERLVTY